MLHKRLSAFRRMVIFKVGSIEIEGVIINLKKNKTTLIFLVEKAPNHFGSLWPKTQSVLQRNEKDMFQMFWSWTHCQCLQERKSIMGTSKEKFELGPEFIGKTIEVSQDLGSESVEPQVVDESPAVEIPAVYGSRTVDESQLKTTDSTQKAVKTHLNVGLQAAGVMNENSSHVTKTEKKKNSIKSPETKKYVNRPCSYVARHEH